MSTAEATAACARARAASRAVASAHASGGGGADAGLGEPSPGRRPATGGPRSRRRRLGDAARGRARVGAAEPCGRREGRQPPRQQGTDAAAVHAVPVKDGEEEGVATAALGGEPGVLVRFGGTWSRPGHARGGGIRACQRRRSIPDAHGARLLGGGGRGRHAFFWGGGGRRRKRHRERAVGGGGRGEGGGGAACVGLCVCVFVSSPFFVGRPLVSPPALRARARVFSEALLASPARAKPPANQPGPVPRLPPSRAAPSFLPPAEAIWSTTHLRSST